MTLKIEVGKYYRTRDGRKVGPMRKGDWETKPFDLSYHADPNINACLWDEDGCADEGRNLDLIAEWTDEPDADGLDYQRQNAPITTPNYNDGKWHGWNGGECPVHLKSIVETVWQFKQGDIRPGKDIGLAGNTSFLGNEHGDLIAFRVVKPYTAPREWWIVGDCEAYASEAEAIEASSTLFGDAKPVHVREVTE